jgi:hypothetical protein
MTCMETWGTLRLTGDALIRKEQAMEFTSIQKALSDPSIVEIY